MPIQSLPDNPNLDVLRRQARALQRAVCAADPAAVERVRRRYPAGIPAQPALFSLSAAQLVLAREYGFASWPRLRRAVLRSRLLYAIEHRDLHTVRQLVTEGVDYRSPYPDGRTPVWHAACTGDDAMWKYLLSPQATKAPDAVAAGWDLLRAAARGDCAQVQQIATGHPGAVAEARLLNPLAVFDATAARQADLIVLLVRLGFDIHASVGRMFASHNQGTALHRAATLKDPQLIHLLLSLGADPTARDDFGYTPAQHVHNRSWAADLGLRPRRPGPTNQSRQRHGTPRATPARPAPESGTPD